MSSYHRFCLITLSLFPKLMFIAEEVDFPIKNLFF